MITNATMPLLFMVHQVPTTPSQSGVSRLARSVEPLIKRRVVRTWHLDLPKVPERVLEAIEAVAEQVIEGAGDKKDLLEHEMLMSGLKYQEKYLEFLQEAIAAMRQQMLDYALDVMEQQRRARNRKAAILLLLS